MKAPHSIRITALKATTALGLLTIVTSADSTTADSTSNSDGDSNSDLMEYAAQTDPNDSESYLVLTPVSIAAALDEISYEITAGPGRFIGVEESTSLDPISWTTSRATSRWIPPEHLAIPCRFLPQLRGVSSA